LIKFLELSFLNNVYTIVIHVWNCMKKRQFKCVKKRQFQELDQMCDTHLIVWC
jgi:hypothetical protein